MVEYRLYGPWHDGQVGGDEIMLKKVLFTLKLLIGINLTAIAVVWFILRDMQTLYLWRASTWIVFSVVLIIEIWLGKREK